jgi:tRNA pseudouridine32 synthase/23S rRNA pseudouridine746 synthase
MLQGLEVEKEGPASASAANVQVVYEDAAVLVVDKPSGMLSVPGRIDAPSVQQLLAARYGEVFMPHRLDMDTSGLLVVARNVDAYKQLQSQFYARTIYKRYMALLDGYLPVGRRGTISLPMRPDPLDRPRQVVDLLHGKQAITDYEVLSLPNISEKTPFHRDYPCVFVSLTPHTGRTHQLRVHCAHPEGLGLPIVGDNLYGQKAHRLCLHATELAFDHPTTGERLHFSSPTDFHCSTALPTGV